MTRWENYLATAEKIIVAYDGAVPLHHFLKGFFKERPQMGSRDRRWVSQLAYQYYRLGHLWKQKSIPERILLGAFLCSDGPNELLAFFRPELEAGAGLPLAARLAMLGSEGQGIEPAAVFPFTAALSPAVDAAGFAWSFLTQPLLFIRCRNKRQPAIVKLLRQAGVSFEIWGDDMLALPNSTSIDSIVTDKSWYEIQDASSQQTGALFRPEAGERWWDCCAASGGKSILLLDQQPGVRLLASDVRPSILQNLRQRFREAGIRNCESMVLDLGIPLQQTALAGRRFDNIILDAPCSGSGTWARTPENLYFFREENIDTYQQLQKRIAGNVISLLQPGGALIYITCSVFKKENEDVVQYLQQSGGMEVQEGGIIKGYHRRADTMFAVRLLKQ